MSATQTSNGRAQADCWGRLRQLRQAEQDALRAWRDAREEAGRLKREWAAAHKRVEAFMDTGQEEAPLFDAADRAEDDGLGEEVMAAATEFMDGLRASDRPLQVSVDGGPPGESASVELPVKPVRVPASEVVGLATDMPTRTVDVGGKRYEIPTGWLVGRVQALEREGLDPLAAGKKAAEQWAEQERLAAGHVPRDSEAPPRGPNSTSVVELFPAADEAHWPVGVLPSQAMKARVRTVADALALDPEKPPKGLSADQAGALLDAAGAWVKAHGGKPAPACLGCGVDTGGLVDLPSQYHMDDDLCPADMIDCDLLALLPEGKQPTVDGSADVFLCGKCHGELLGRHRAQEQEPAPAEERTSSAFKGEWIGDLRLTREQVERACIVDKFQKTVKAPIPVRPVCLYGGADLFVTVGACHQYGHSSWEALKLYDPGVFKDKFPAREPRLEPAHPHANDFERRNAHWGVRVRVGKDELIIGPAAEARWLTTKEPKPAAEERPWEACKKCGGTGRVCRKCKRGEGRVSLKQDYCACAVPDFDLCKKCGGNGREYLKPKKKAKAPPIDPKAAAFVHEHFCPKGPQTPLVGLCPNCGVKVDDDADSGPDALCGVCRIKARQKTAQPVVSVGPVRGEPIGPLGLSAAQLDAALFPDPWAAGAKKPKGPPLATVLWLGRVNSQDPYLVAEREEHPGGVAWRLLRLWTHKEWDAPGELGSFWVKNATGEKPPDLADDDRQRLTGLVVKSGRGKAAPEYVVGEWSQSRVVVEQAKED